MLFTYKKREIGGDGMQTPNSRTALLIGAYLHYI